MSIDRNENPIICTAYGKLARSIFLKLIIVRTLLSKSFRSLQSFGNTIFFFKCVWKKNVTDFLAIFQEFLHFLLKEWCNSTILNSTSKNSGKNPGKNHMSVDYCFLGMILYYKTLSPILLWETRVIWKATHSSQERFIGRIFYCPNKFDANVPKWGRLRAFFPLLDFSVMLLLNIYLIYLTI